MSKLPIKIKVTEEMLKHPQYDVVGMHEKASGKISDLNDVLRVSEAPLVVPKVLQDIQIHEVSYVSSSPEDKKPHIILGQPVTIQLNQPTSAWAMKKEQQIYEEIMKKIDEEEKQERVKQRCKNDRWDNIEI